MTDTMISLVTGGNKGIGREIASGLAGLGHTVVIGARRADLGEKAAADLRGDGAAGAAGADVTSVVLDVTDPDSARAAAAEIESRYGRLDALVNNAAISRTPDSDLTSQLPSTADLDVIRTIFETNVFGVITATNAMLPLLRRSPAPRIVNVSSSAGSLAGLAELATGAGGDDDPIAVGYVPSKTALTAVTLLYARELRPENILVNAVNPGFCATDLNGNAGHRSADQGAAAAVRMATVAPDGPTATFTDDEGTVPW